MASATKYTTLTQVEETVVKTVSVERVLLDLSLEEAARVRKLVGMGAGDIINVDIVRVLRLAGVAC